MGACAMDVTEERVRLGNDQFSDGQIAATLSPRLQQLIILPTEKCNFRCTYCYEDFQIGKMREPVIAGIERFVERRISDLSQLSLSWFGGEPLMARNVVLRISSHASRLCDDHGVVLDGGLTTNGYILDFALFEELLSYNQRFFQITFDGWQEEHDAVRQRANGRPTFQRIWDNMLATRRSRQDFHIQFRVHVRRENMDGVKLLLGHLAASFGSDERYSLDFQHLRNLGGEGGKSIDRPLTMAEMRELEAELRSWYDAEVARAAEGATNSTLAPSRRAVSAMPIGEVRSAAPEAQPYICYAAKPNSLLVRADGRIGKCTVALNDDRNTIGRINEDGTLTLDNTLLRPWIRGLGDLNPAVLSCPLSGMPPAAIAELPA